MQGNQPNDTTVNTKSSAYSANDLSYPAEEIAAIPSQQVGFVPQKELKIKSTPIQSVSTDVEKQRAELEALMQKQTVEEPSPASIQPATPTPVIIPTPVPIPVAEDVPEPIAMEEQVSSILKSEINPPTEAELRGQELAALAQSQSAPEPIVESTSVVAPQQPAIQTATISEPTENEMEIGPMARVQSYAPTKTPSLVPQATPEPQELQKHPFAEVEQAPKPAPVTTASTSTIEARIVALEQKIDTLITEVRKWV